jgi:hypothetical protein
VGPFTNHFSPNTEPGVASFPWGEGSGELGNVYTGDHFAKFGTRSKKKPISIFYQFLTFSRSG